MPSTLDLFTRELKYLGVSSTLWEIYAHKAQAQTQTWGDPRRSVVAYVDGTSKEVHTQLFSQATKVSQRNQVLPALEVVAVHSGVGVPLSVEPTPLIDFIPASRRSRRLPRSRSEMPCLPS